MTMPVEMTEELEDSAADDPDERYVALVRIVGTEVETVAPAFGSCMTWNLPQAGVNVPVQLLTRRHKRHKAKIQVQSLGTQGANTTGINGSVTDPTALQNIAFSGSLPAGTYNIQATVYLAGTVNAGDANNFRLTAGGRTVLNIACPPVANVPVTINAQATLTTAGFIGIIAPLAGSNAAVIYNASATITPLSGGSGVTVVFNTNADNLSLANPVGFTASNVGGIPDWESMQPLYAVAVGGTAVISVIDESYGEVA